jgi:hypothetical protein
VSPLTVYAVVRLITPGVVADPLAAGVHVGRVGMAFLVPEVAALLWGRMLIRTVLLLRMLLDTALLLGMRFRRTALLRTLGRTWRGCRFWAALGDVRARHAGRSLRRRARMLIVLGDGRERKQNAGCKESEDVFHSFNPPQFESAKCSERG